jgi:hypothetical protein
MQGRQDNDQAAPATNSNTRRVDIESVSDGDGSSRKRKTREATPGEDEAASASTVGASKASSEAGWKEDQGSAPDLSTVEGQQSKHPNMNLDEARFQVRLVPTVSSLFRHAMLLHSNYVVQ